MPAFASLMAMVGLVVPAAAGSVIHVDASAPDGGNGQTWGTAFNDLQDAIATAVPGDELWIAAATYTPAPPGGPRAATFELIEDIALYGGFAGFENTLDERDPEVNITILSGDLNGDDDPDDPATRDDNTYHVIEATDLDGPVILDGLTLRAANNDLAQTDDDGGGLYIFNADAVIHDCRIAGNSANGRGAGVFALGDSQLTVTECRFETNLVPLSLQFSGGAGLVVVGVDATISGCRFEGNVSGYEAGGLLAVAASAIVTDCEFLANQALKGGGVAMVAGGQVEFHTCQFRSNLAAAGGAANLLGGQALFTGCLFADNTSDAAGGAIYSDTGGTTIDACTFSGNGALRGAAIATTIGDVLNVSNSVFMDNHAASVGGAIFVDRSAALISATAFTGNTAITGGAVHTFERTFEASATITGCQFTTNSAAFGGALSNETITDVVVTESTFQGNHADFEGGAVFNVGSSPEFTGCTFTGNTADPIGGAGGALANCDDSDPVLTTCTFTQNSAAEGGALSNFLRCDPTVDGCMFEGNSAMFGGAVRNFIDCAPTFVNTDLRLNTAEECGGAIWSRLCAPELIECLVDANVADRGAGLCNVENQCTITGGTISNNAANLSGGGIRDEDGSLTVITGVTFESNVSTFQNGGAVHSLESELQVSGCTFDDNGHNAVVAGNGLATRFTVVDSSFTEPECTAAILSIGGPHLVSNCTFDVASTAVSLGNATVENCTFTNGITHVSFRDIGGVATGCTFDGAAAVGLTSSGDGIARAENCLFRNCTSGVAGDSLSDNILVEACTFESCTWAFFSYQARVDAVNCIMRYNETAIRLDSNASLTASNCLITHNQWAIRSDTDEVADLRNCTIADNAELTVFEDATLSIRNSVVRRTPLALDDRATVTILHSDVELPGGEVFPGAGNINADPLFADPDGPDDVPGTDDDDFTLQPSSPCIDAGHNWGLPADALDLDGDGLTAELLPLDLDGLGRIADDRGTADAGCGQPAVVDMGAFEFPGIVADDVIFADLTGDGIVDVPDLLELLGQWGACNPCCLADLDVDGSVGVLDLLILLGAWG